MCVGGGGGEGEGEGEGGGGGEIYTIYRKIAIIQAKNIVMPLK